MRKITLLTVSLDPEAKRMLVPVSGVSASGMAAYHRRRRATKSREVCQSEIKQLSLSGGGIGGGSGGCLAPFN